MNCPRESEVLLLGTGAIGPERAAMLQAHVEACAQCTDAIHLVAATAAVLRAAPVEARPEEVRRIERALVNWHAGRATWRPMHFVLAGATAAAVLVLAVMRLFPGTPVQSDMTSPAVAVSAPPAVELSPRRLPPETPARLAAQSKVYAGRARVVAGSEADLSFKPGPELDLISLEDGYIALALDEVETPKPFVVATPLARVEAVAAVFQVKSGADGTVVHVDSGAVRVIPADGSGERTLHAEEKLRVGPREIAPHAANSNDAPREREPVRAAKSALRETELARSTKPKPEPLHAASEGRPEPAAELVALMSRADAARRAGDLETALRDYLRAADHPRAGSYGEEALLRAARLELALHRSSEAKQELARAGARYGRGTLLPERTALSASIARGAGDLEEAIAILETLPASERSVGLAEERLAIARELSRSDPARARALIAPLASSGPGAAIRDSARSLLQEIDARR